MVHRHEAGFPNGGALPGVTGLAHKLYCFLQVRAGLGAAPIRNIPGTHAGETVQAAFMGICILMVVAESETLFSLELPPSCEQLLELAYRVTIRTRADP